MGKYRKFFVAFGGAILTTALTLWAPDTAIGQVLVIIAAAATAAGVYGVRNDRV